MSALKKKIKIKFVDQDGFDDVALPLLRKHYEIEFSDNPDYLFYSNFGKEHLKYDCIKIFSTGECVIPNFNECDYATGFDYIDFSDRYLRLPLCSSMVRNGKSILETAYNRGEDLPEVKEKKFCSFVVSNAKGMYARTAMFNLLNTYKKVDSGGKYLNNIGYCVDDKRLFEHEHKFCLTFENTRYPGYTTEKISDAFSSGAIPIYFGDPLVDRIFNPKAFINVSDFSDFNDAFEYIRKVDNDDELYQSILNEPIYINRPNGLEELEDFLCHIIDQDLSKAPRRPKTFYAYDVERNIGKL